LEKNRERRFQSARDIEFALEESSTPTVTSGAVFNFRVIGTCGVPLSAASVFITVTAVSPTAGGFIVVYPNPSYPPATSLLNVDPGERALANGTIVGLGTDPALQLSATYGTCCGQGSTHLVVDVMGYYTP
jgi:hypothetical protein